MIFVTILMIGCRCPQPRTDSDARLFAAIRQVESGDRWWVVNVYEHAYGPYQCREMAWRDGGGSPEEWPTGAFDAGKTEAVMRRYWHRYGAVTDEQKARIWNGGPRGMKKRATKRYWRKVQEAMRERTD
jgi:hypothetical protein